MSSVIRLGAGRATHHPIFTQPARLAIRAVVGRAMDLRRGETSERYTVINHNRNAAMLHAINEPDLNRVEMIIVNL